MQGGPPSFRPADGGITVLCLSPRPSDCPLLHSAPSPPRAKQFPLQAAGAAPRPSWRCPERGGSQIRGNSSNSGSSGYGGNAREAQHRRGRCDAAAQLRQVDWRRRRAAPRPCLPAVVASGRRRRLPPARAFPCLLFLVAAQLPALLNPSSCASPPLAAAAARGGARGSSFFFTDDSALIKLTPVNAAAAYLAGCVWILVWPLLVVWRSGRRQHRRCLIARVCRGPQPVRAPARRRLSSSPPLLSPPPQLLACSKR